MNWVRLGRALRALRRRVGWRQRDLAAAARCSQALISRVERGRGDLVLPRTLDAIAKSLGARVVTYLDWNGEALDRLLDSAHAALVDQLVRHLRSIGWDTVTEQTFAIGGERGSVDVLAWHPETQVMVVVEVKSVLADVQDTLARLDRKVRLATRIAPANWHGGSVSSLLVVADTRTNRRRVARLEATFGIAFPDRIASIRRFLRSPAQVPIRGLWFLPSITPTTPRHRIRHS